MTESANRLSGAKLRPFLGRCGYRSFLVETNVRLPSDGQAALVAFAHAPRDARSACIAAIDAQVDPSHDAASCRPLGAPIVFVCFPDRLEWWIQGTAQTERRESIPAGHVSSFFDRHRGDFAPEAIYRAKTFARFDKSWHLDFVDLGLMPLVEEEAGRKLEQLVERAVLGTKKRLGWEKISDEDGHWLLKSNFWLLAAKILKDKKVPTFADLNLENLEDVYHRLARHYGSAEPVRVGSKRRAEALRESAREISNSSHMGLVSTEALAYLYENALISKETRTALGTHSTPAYLVDYIVGKLRPWIEEIDVSRRFVFEPACGHAAFLLAALRLLGELLPEDMSQPSRRHKYLRERLGGCDVDSFALEIARLSLTLADVPNPNGWDLKTANMFEGDLLASQTRPASIVLANPPFENFSNEERIAVRAQHVNKAAEMLWRVVTGMQPGSVFGVILPQGLLHSKDGESLREVIAKKFEIAEICLLPDKDIFTVSEAESAIVIGRRLRPNQQITRPISHRRVREADVGNFKRAYETTMDCSLYQSSFCAEANWRFLVPDLEEVWKLCKGLPRYNDVAEIGQGFSFRSLGDPAFPKGAITECARRRRGFVRGFVRLREDLKTHALPDERWVNLDPGVILAPRHGTTTGIPQVLLNYARVSRGPWRLKAFLDKQGHAVTSRFIVIRPTKEHWPVESLWAICNSPLANAYSYAFSGKRDVLVGLMREMPVPSLKSKDLAPLVKMVRAYFRTAKRADGLFPPHAIVEKLKTLHWRIDAEVLRLYNLPPHLERQILDLFCGNERQGVLFEQKEYLPKSFPEPLTLRDLLTITVDWDETNDRRAHLIMKEEKRTIRSQEKADLEHLQRLADLRIDLLAPLPIKELEAIASDLKRRGMWVDD